MLWNKLLHWSFLSGIFFSKVYSYFKKYLKKDDSFQGGAGVERSSSDQSIAGSILSWSILFPVVRLAYGTAALAFQLQSHDKCVHGQRRKVYTGQHSETNIWGVDQWVWVSSLKFKFSKAEKVVKPCKQSCQKYSYSTYILKHHLWVKFYFIFLPITCVKLCSITFQNTFENDVLSHLKLFIFLLNFYWEREKP